MMNSEKIPLISGLASLYFSIVNRIFFFPYCLFHSIPRLCCYFCFCTQTHVSVKEKKKRSRSVVIHKSAGEIRTPEILISPSFTGSTTVNPNLSVHLTWTSSLSDIQGGCKHLQHRSQVRRKSVGTQRDVDLSI